MIIKFSLSKLSIFFLLVILFPLVQNQWLNLYLFDINIFSFYKVLYYLSGLIFPILIIINSLNNFTYYKFNNNKTNYKINNNPNITGKFLFFITSISLIILSIMISHYIFINFKILLNFFSNNNELQFLFDSNKKTLFILIISILLIFKKTKLFMKKIILINYFIISILIWYSKINNILLNDFFPLDIFRIENINFINILLLLAIETVYYLWSYISYSSYLSDWSVPLPYKKQYFQILNIIFFYLLIIVYYSILSN